MFCTSKAHIRVHGTLSNLFELKAAQDGHPLLPLIFPLCIEPLTLSIGGDEEIKGIEMYTA